MEGIFTFPSINYRHGLGWRSNPLKALLFTRRGILQLQEPLAKGEPAKGSWILNEDVQRLVSSQILLYGRLQVWSLKNDREPAVDVEYNMVSHHLLAPFLRGFLRRTWSEDARGAALLKPDPTFQDFQKISFSFYNGLAIEALQPGEVILGYVFQKEIRQPVLRFFYRKVFPQTVLALTDRQLILLQQELQIQSHHEWIFTFIPVHRVIGMDTSAFKTWGKISVQIQSASGQQPLEVILESEQAQKWLALWEENRPSALIR